MLIGEGQRRLDEAFDVAARLTECECGPCSQECDLELVARPLVRLDVVEDALRVLGTLLRECGSSLGQTSASSRRHGSNECLCPIRLAGEQVEVSGRGSDPRQQSCRRVDLLGEQLGSRDGLESVIQTAPLDEEPDLVHQTEEFDGRPFPLDRAQRLLEQGLGLIEFEAFEVHCGDDAERFTGRIVLPGPAFVGELQCGSPESICGVQVTGVAFDGTMCARHDDCSHRGKTVCSSFGSESADPVEVVEVVPDAGFGDGQLPCDVLGRVEQMPSTDRVRHRAMRTSPSHLPERLRRCETTSKDGVHLGVVEKCEAPQPPTGFVERPVHPDREGEFECEFSLLTQCRVVEQVDQASGPERVPGEVVADEPVTKQRDGPRGRPGADRVIHGVVEIALALEPLRRRLVQEEFSLLVAQAQLCLQQLREQVVVPVAPALVIERHDEQSACLDVSKSSMRIGLAGDRLARSSIQFAKHRRRQEKVGDVFGLLVQDLRGQVVGEISIR
jgi:hypothetical protein